MSAVATSASPFERWMDLFDKGMHQLARLEVRSAAVAREPRPEILFALGMSELVLRRWRESERAFRKAGAVLGRTGTAGLPPNCGNLGAVVARILEQKDLRQIPPPNTVGWWLENPQRVGSKDDAPLKPGRLPTRIEGVRFKSPLNMDSMKVLEQRAGSFSYSVFDLRTGTRSAGEMRDSYHKQPPGTTHREATRSESDRSTKSADRVRLPASGTIERPAAVVAPPPPPPQAVAQAPGIGWFMGSESKPAAPAREFTRADREHPRFEILAVDHVEPPPPAPPGDPWAKWEEELYHLVRAGQFGEATKRVRAAVEKYPTSSRLREHEANILGASGDSGGALRSWKETFKLASDTGADDRADVAARKAISIAWNDGPELTRLAKELAATGKPGLVRGILGAVAERMVEDKRVAAVESIGLALAELALRDASARPEAQRIASIIETITGDDASAVAKRLRERLSRQQ